MPGPGGGHDLPDRAQVEEVARELTENQSLQPTRDQVDFLLSRLKSLETEHEFCHEVEEMAANRLKSLEEENGQLKERAAKTTVAEFAEQARLINERDDLQSRLNATEEKIRKMIEALELVLAHPVSGETLGTILYNVIEYYRALAEEGKGKNEVQKKANSN